MKQYNYAAPQEQLQSHSLYNYASSCSVLPAHARAMGSIPPPNRRQT